MALGEDEENWFPSWQLSQGQEQNPGALSVGDGLEPGHRIIESLRLRNTLYHHRVQPLTQHHYIHHYVHIPKRHITCILNTSRDADSTTSQSSLFHCLITLSVKKFFLISS